jgi:hypothetical protein
MKIVSLLAATALLWSLCGEASAADRARANAGAQSGSTSAVILEQGAIMMGAPGAGGAAAAAASSTGFFNPQWILGQTTNTAAPSTFNACGVSVGVAVGPVSYSDSSESSDCVAQRLAELFLAQGNPTMATEMLCRIKAVDEADRTSHSNRCPKQRAAMAKAQPAAAVPVAAVAPVVVQNRLQCIRAAESIADYSAYKAATAQCPVN